MAPFNNHIKVAENIEAATHYSAVQRSLSHASKRTRLQTENLDTLYRQIVDIIGRSEEGVQQIEIVSAIPRALRATQQRLERLERLGIIVSVCVPKHGTYYFLNKNIETKSFKKSEADGQKTNLKSKKKNAALRANSRDGSTGYTNDIS